MVNADQLKAVVKGIHACNPLSVQYTQYTQFASITCPFPGTVEPQTMARGVANLSGVYIALAEAPKPAKEPVESYRIRSVASTEPNLAD